MTAQAPRASHGKLWKRARKQFLALCVKFPVLRKVRFLRWRQLGKKYERMAAGVALDEHAVVFECFGGRKYGCSPKALYLAMLADPRFEGWTFYWCFRASLLDEMAAEPTLQRATLVTRSTDEYLRCFAHAKYWVLNNRVAEWIAPREGQVYVQCWHGTPLKKLGCDVPETSTGGALNSAAELAQRFRMDSAKWTYLLAPSDYTAQHLADAFGLPQERRARTLLVEGYPRNDSIRATLDAPDCEQRCEAIRSAIDAWLPAQLLKRIAKDRGCAPEELSMADVPPELAPSLQLPRGKKVLLYAPTFRDDQYTPGVGYSFEMDIDLDGLQRELGDEWVVLLRMHYYIANKADLTPWAGFAYDVSAWPDINQLYVISDALCTDYSSVFFDYANTGRPIYFLWADFQHYGQELHGFYLDPLTLPGPKCESGAEFTQALAANGTWSERYGAGYERFRSQFCPHDDGQAAQRVVERVFG